MSQPVQPRPQPVMDEVSPVGQLSASAVFTVGVVWFLVTGGVNSNNLLTVANAFGAAATALIALGSWIYTRGRARAAAARVTPTEAPMRLDPQTGQLVPLLTAREWEHDAATAGKHSEVHAAPQEPATEPYARLRASAYRPTPYPRGDAPITPALRPLGRIVRHDPRSLRYLVPETTTVQSVMWERKTPILDQGNLGSCTGNATVGVLGSTPFWDTVNILVPLDEDEAIKVYSLATQLDDIGGTYPPNDTGSSGLGAAQAAKQLGLISGYQHIVSVSAAHTAIQQGPFIVGTDWLTGMDNPDAYGVVHATGSVRGGHEYECIGYDAVTDRWAFCNSWGPGWGLNGRFYYSSADFAKLLAAQGDATTFVPLTQPAPQPTPDPTPTPAPAIPADWVAWAKHVRTLKNQSRLTEQVAQEILAAAGQ